MAMISGLISLATVFHANDETAEKAIEMRKKRKIKLPDAIIVTMAIVNGFTLITQYIRF